MSSITNPAESFFKDGVWGWDGSVWRKLPLIFGYSDRWSAWHGKTMTANENFDFMTVAVPAGYIYILQSAMIVNNSGARGMTHIYLYDGSNAYPIATDLTPAAWIPMVYSDPVVLKPGDRVGLKMFTCLINDVIEAGVWGYKMRITA